MTPGTAGARRKRPPPDGEAIPSRFIADSGDGGATLLDEFLAEPSDMLAFARWLGARESTRGLADGDAVREAIDRDVAALDRLINAQVNAILHHPRLQRLEAAWRGVHFLVTEADGVEGVKIRILNVTWKELANDLERAIEFDQSRMFGLVHSQEFGMAGGEPFGVLIGDYAVGHRRGADHPVDDLAVLRGMSQVAAAAFSPFVIGAAPALLGLESFGELAMASRLAATFRQAEYVRWNAFRDTEDARFVGVVLPRVLMRLPYGDDLLRLDGFRFREEVEGADHEGYLWGNAGFAFASILIRAFSESGWFADIRGTRLDEIGSGLVATLPVHCFDTDAAGIAIKYSAEVSIPERQDMELSGLGLIPLLDVKNTGYSAFYSNQSVQRPKRYEDALATANANISSMLQYILCVSRFSHYLKVMARDRTGTFATSEECERFLSRWLLDYCLANDEATPAQKARHPLREARVAVREIPGRPGSFHCSAELQPHFQLDRIVSSFKMTTELASRQPTS